MTSMEYIRDYYKVPAEVGRLVIVDGDSGIITGARNAHIMVNFDKDKPSHSLPAHPTWEVEYGKMGRPRKMTRSQQRYRDYLHSEVDCTFAEWLGTGRRPMKKAIRDMEANVDIFEFEGRRWLVMFGSINVPKCFWCRLEWEPGDKLSPVSRRIHGDKEYEIIGRRLPDGTVEGVGDKGHKWKTAPKGYDYCGICGVMRRTDGKPQLKACPGHTPIELRGQQ